MSTARNAAAVGMFDGVHRGHLDILSTVAREARRAGGHPVVLSFGEHPVSLLRPGEAPRLLTTPAEKEELIRRFLPDAEVHLLDFAAMRRESAADFLRGLRDRLGVGTMVMGYDNRFGCDGPREREAYDALGAELGVRVVHVPRLTVGTGTASSTAVRRLVAAGDVRAAASMLGRRYGVSGTVGGGRRLGRTIGYPTANINVDPVKLLPARGVYACVAAVEGRRYPAMVNIGYRPTVDVSTDPQLSVEAHLIGADADMYGCTVRMLFVERLRDELHFPDIKALQAQLGDDRRNALACLRAEYPGI
ncbi:MAG: riboflavin biosynthesis protein RibF [Muribaculaceae bacterium]|nr:riboflavin biosynthesis protein RibF [Muribaculaceae bacterium]